MRMSANKDLGSFWQRYGGFGTDRLAGGILDDLHMVSMAEWVIVVNNDLEKNLLKTSWRLITWPFLA